MVNLVVSKVFKKGCAKIGIANLCGIESCKLTKQILLARYFRGAKRRREVRDIRL